MPMLLLDTGVSRVQVSPVPGRILIVMIVTKPIMLLLLTKTLRCM